jgi:hypothetical protein
VLAANNNPDSRTISDFRQGHLAPLGGFFLKVLELSARLDWPSWGTFPWMEPR